MSDGHHLWSERYDRELDDVFAIQDEIAQSIARRLRAGTVSEPSRERLTASMDAYEEYLRGRFFWAKGSPDDYAKSVDCYEQAVALDPGFAQAYVALADTCFYWSIVGDSLNLMPRARAAVEKALELDDTLAEAHGTLGWIRFFGEWDWAAAMEALERALSLNPNSAQAHQAFGVLKTNLGRVDEAVVHARRGVELDPVSAQTLQSLQFALHQAGQYEESLACGDKALEVAPDYLFAHLVVGFTLLEVGRLDEAEGVWKKMLAISPDEPQARAGMAQVFARLDRRNDALECARDLERRASAGVGQAAVSTAWAHAAVGNVDEAFEWIDRAIARREQWLVCLPSFAWWDPLRSDPRFEQVLRRLRFPEWSIAVSSERVRDA